MYRIALCDIPDTTLRCSTLLDIANDEKMVFVHVIVVALVTFLQMNIMGLGRLTVFINICQKS